MSSGRAISSQNDARDFDVVVVGCGPVGALAANLLGKAGLKTLVVEREAVPYPQPRAVHLDHEMMRLFQDIDLVDVLRPMMRETQGHLHIGADQGVIRYMGTAGRPKPFGWANDYFFWQPELEQGLRDGLARFADVELRLGTLVTAFRRDDSGVRIVLRDSTEELTVTARWMIACDGARSFVRKSLDIALDDLDFEEPWLVVDAEVEGDVDFPNLWGVPPEADLQQLSVMMCDPERPATIVPGRGAHRRWEFMLLPGEDDAEMMRPERVAALLKPYLGGVPHRIARAATYRFHGLIAERWREGAVFLAGDSSHQTPPFFGQGMCHGMRDVANLVWKLVLVGRGAPDALLDSYQEERAPHVRAVVSSAIEAGRYICELNPERAAARDVAMRGRAREVPTGTAADLIPPLASGIVVASAGAGERFVQPILDDGRKLDDVTGGGWRLFLHGPAMPSDEALAPLGVRAFRADSFDDGGALVAWLQAHAARAVLVRPDFYVCGTGNDPGELLDLASLAVLGAEPAVFASSGETR